MSLIVGAGVGIGFGGRKWTPKRLGTALAAWYRSDMGVTIATGVSAWADQSGNGRHLLQGVAGAQPALVAGATPNGRPVLRFDGSVDSMQVAFTLNQPCTRIVVAKWTNRAGYNYLIDGAAGTDYCSLYRGAGSSTSYLYCGSTGPNVSPTDATWYVYEDEPNGSACKLRLNGGTASQANGGTRNPGGVTLGNAGGGSYAAIADISEVIIVNRVLTAAERSALTAYARAWSGV